MNWLDIVILSITLVFVLLGLKHGLISEAVSILALVLGIVGGVMFHSYAGELFMEYDLVENRAIASVGGFIAVALAVYIVLQIFGWVLTKIIGTLHLTWADRIGGGVFGALKAVVVSFLLVSALGFFFGEREPPFSDSALIPYVNDAFLVLREVVPEDFREKLQRGRELVQEKGIQAAIEEADRVKGIFKEEGGKQPPEPSRPK